MPIVVRKQAIVSRTMSLSSATSTRRGQGARRSITPEVMWAETLRKRRTGSSGGAPWFLGFQNQMNQGGWESDFSVEAEVKAPRYALSEDKRVFARHQRMRRLELVSHEFPVGRPPLGPGELHQDEPVLREARRGRTPASVVGTHDLSSIVLAARPEREIHLRFRHG